MGTAALEDVLIFGHADGDGHLAAECSRRNVLAEGARSCRVIVGPEITPGWRFWEQSFEHVDLGGASLVITVDLMLNGRSPASSLQPIVHRARAEPHRQFVVIDHHPVEMPLGDLPSNLLLDFTHSVYGCVYGPPDDSMIVASICDRDEWPVHERITPLHRTRALGIRRAVADRGRSAGDQLMAVLAHDRWDLVEELGAEPVDLHRMVRGTRSRRAPYSAALEAIRHHT